VVQGLAQEGNRAEAPEGVGKEREAVVVEEEDQDGGGQDEEEDEGEQQDGKEDFKEDDELEPESSVVQSGVIRLTPLEWSDEVE
jgi:hypothetical protein